MLPSISSLPAAETADAVVPRKVLGPKQIRDAAQPLTTSSLAPRHADMRAAGTSAKSPFTRRSEGRDSYGAMCLVVIAVGVAASVVVLVVASAAIICARKGFRCKHCGSSALEEQKWPGPSMVHEAYPPWLLNAPKQPEQPQVPVLHREQSWASTSTVANNQHDAVSPTDPQTWDGAQYTWYAGSRELDTAVLRVTDAL
ncbi:uncharacterized protein MAM_01407 [Metarhizium album ARSEF 1941]|uniref:Uncharacterized protein n=1 Tax=Metarhizium album (strain ARSEF 1941) TaxID=1081103 RepID=A0A0B2X2U0_METAS|nr:uncharacterized protein MAM_01407 [Metarhizium album ARSEF 1941]KHO00629.1 hypothetical protein MAM_01407 [Metarhizium album ARSEF 1941]